MDINLDAQWSERIQDERRSDLVFAEINRNLSAPLDANGEFITGVAALDADGVNDAIADTVTIQDGILQEFTNAGQEIQLIGQDFTRDEEYQGIGLTVEYQVNEDLAVSFDASYSNTFRVEEEESLRLGDEVERLVSADFTNSNFVGEFGVTDFEGNAFTSSDLGEFLAGATADGVGSTEESILAQLVASDTNSDDRIRFRSQEDIRENTITSLRGDFELQTSDKLGFITSVEGGVRFSELEYERRGNVNSEVTADNFSDDLTDQFEDCLLYTSPSPRD